MVRLNAATAGNYSGNIIHTTAGATAVQMPLSGTTVNPPAISVNDALRHFSQTLGTPSAIQLLPVSGQYLTGNLTIKAADPFELSMDGITWFGSNSTLVFTPVTGVVATRNVQVRLNAASIGTHTGALTITTSGLANMSIPVAGTTRPGFTIYPNPAHNFLVVYHPKRYTIGKLYVYNIKGTTVATHYTRTSENSTSVDISALPAGVYFVEYRLLNEKS